MDDFDDLEDLDALAECMREAEDAENEADKLASGLRPFLQQIEEALLSLDRSPAAPIVPAGLAPELQAECEALVKLLRPARAGDINEFLSHAWAEPLAEALSRAQVAAALTARGLPQLHSEVISACTKFVSEAPPGAAPARQLAVLLLAVSALQLYSQANWTGPAVDSEVGPFNARAPAEEIQCGKELLTALEVDGEEFYELICGPGYLWLACIFLGVLQLSGSAAEGRSLRESSSVAVGSTLSIWRARCAFAWQLSLAEASERGVGQSAWLFKVAVHDLVDTSESRGILAAEGFLTGSALAKVQAVTAPVLQTWRQCRIEGKVVREALGPPTVVSQEGSTEAAVATDANASSAGVATATVLFSSCPEVRAALLVEFCIRLCWYGRMKEYDLVLEVACSEIAFKWEVTGVMGIKRKYQTTDIAQMMVKTSSGIAESKEPTKLDASESENIDPSDAINPANLKLSEMDDMNDVLEGPKLSETVAKEDRDQLEKPLAAAEQLVLLSRCQYLWASSNPNDEMVLEVINALAQRVLVTSEKPEDMGVADGPMFTANWLSFSCGLFYRCRTEHHRNKTRERAAFQLQALVDQFNDEKPSAAHRLQLVHSSGYPARFHLQHEMGTRMMRMGMVSTAHEQFKKLRMWPDAIDCLMIAGRNVECLDMVNDLLKKSPTPRLWCVLGDLEKDPKHYETAWELSNQRFARAMRSLARHHLRKDDMVKAVDCFQLALQINPLHSDVWFSMGVGQMKLERYDDAAITFSRCINVDDEHSEAWANLAATHSARGLLKEARSCAYEATRRNRTSWRMWDSFLGICQSLKDIQGCLTAMKQLSELGQIQKVTDRLLGTLTMSVIRDAPGLYENRTGWQSEKQLMDFFKYITGKRASEPSYWRFFALLQDAKGLDQDAFESRLRQARSALAKIWAEADPEVFGTQLETLTECFLAIEKTFQDPSLASVTSAQHQPFAYMVRNAERQLGSKVEASGGQAPAAWKEEHATISDLATRLEEIAAA